MPRRTEKARVRWIEALRRRRLTGMAIARRLGMPRSTVAGVLKRLGLERLSRLAPRRAVVRYERARLVDRTRGRGFRRVVPSPEPLRTDTVLEHGRRRTWIRDNDALLLGGAAVG